MPLCYACSEGCLRRCVREVREGFPGRPGAARVTCGSPAGCYVRNRGYVSDRNPLGGRVGWRKSPCPRGHSGECEEAPTERGGWDRKPEGEGGERRARTAGRAAGERFTGWPVADTRCADARRREIVYQGEAGTTCGSGLCRGPSYPGRVLNHPREAVPSPRPPQSAPGREPAVIGDAGAGRDPAAAPARVRGRSAAAPVPHRAPFRPCSTVVVTKGAGKDRASDSGLQ